MGPSRRVLIAVFDGVELLDVTGPAEVFSSASRLPKVERGYSVELVAQSLTPIRTAGGLRLVPDLRFRDAAGEVDTVIVPGAIDSSAQPLVLSQVVDWTRRVESGARRVASVCAGAHMLAQAGLLDGLSATTHWYTAEKLALDFPNVRVDPDPIFIRAGRVWTSAGVSAGMDLALAMVADDHGEAVARRVARWLVMYLKRPGGQSQFSVPLSTPAPDREDIGGLQRWMAENPGADLSVPALARRMNLSDRHFARVFAQQTGITPAAHVDAIRVEAARRMLEQTDQALETVASKCGFGSVETLYRTFRRRQGMTPTDYRLRFRSPV